MLVLNTTSPEASPSAPKEYPSNTNPSANARIAFFILRSFFQSAIPRLGIPRLPPGVESASSRPAYRVVARKQFREVALFVGASGSCRRGLHSELVPYRAVDI